MSEPKSCFGDFCLPSDARLVGHQQPADFDLYQVDWRDSRYGIYAGDFPDFEPASGEELGIAIDHGARLKVDGKQGQILAKLGTQSPRYLHITGPCATLEKCALADFADAVRRPD